jgi:hypothetical protein
LNLGLRLALIFNDVLAIFLALLEWESEQLKQRSTFRIVLGGGYDGNVHTARAIDLVLFNLREDNLLGKSKGVIAISIELLR